jgi:hypothetical protein
MSTAIAKIIDKPETRAMRGTASVHPIVPQDFDQAFRFAQMVHSSGMAPTGLGKPEALMAAILHGLEVGMTPMNAIQVIAVVNGRAVIFGDGAIGLVRGSGLCEYVDEKIEGDGDAMVATCETKRVGEPRAVVRRFSVADAKAASLWGKSGPWKLYPARMLQMRARGFALRDAFADVLRGLAIREEVEDYPQAPQPPTPPTPPVPPTPPAAALAPPKVEPAKVEPAKVIDAEPVEAATDAPAEPEPEPVGVGQLVIEIEAAETDEALSSILEAWAPAMAEWPQADRITAQNAYEARSAALAKPDAPASAEPPAEEPALWQTARDKAAQGSKRFRLWFGGLDPQQQAELNDAPHDFAELAAEADGKAPS